MSSFTVGTVLFFARTVVIESADDGQTAPPPLPTPSRPEEKWQIHITDETLEWLSTTTLVVGNGDPSNFERSMYRPVSGRAYDEQTNLALGAWATALINGEFAREEHTRVSSNIQSTANDHPQEMLQIKSQFVTSIMWMAYERHEARSSSSRPSSSSFQEWLGNGRGDQNTYVRHLIIRQIGPDLTEWMEIIQGVHNKEDIFLIQLDQSRVDQLQFVPPDNGETQLTDVSDLFTEHRKMDLQRIISEESERKSFSSEDEERQTWLALMSAQSRLEAITDRQERKERRDHFNVEQMISTESFERSAIQRDGIDGIISLQEMSAKESTRCQLEIAKMKKTRDLEMQQIRADAQKEFESQKSAWYEDKKRMQNELSMKKSMLSEDNESLRRKNEQISERLESMETQNAEYQRQINAQRARHTQELSDMSELRREQERSTLQLSEQQKTFGDERAVWGKMKEHMVHELEIAQVQNKDLQSNLETLRSEMASAKEQHEEKVQHHEENESVLEQQIADLQNDIHTARTARDQAKDALDQAADDHLKREKELEAELVSLSESLNRDFDEERETLKTEKENEKHDQMMMFMYIGGGSLVVFAIFFAVWRWRANKSASEDMECELNAQLKRVKEPHPLVPEYPSAHANRLGVHEHPAVRDVFGMKEPWDVTPGEGFHVSRITKGGKTPGTIREGTDEGDVTITIVGDPMNHQESADVVEEDLESGVLQHEGVNVG